MTQGNLFRCPVGGCYLRDRKGVRHCEDQVWEKPTTYSRKFPQLHRASPEWKQLYGLRQSVERVFKSLKQSRRLESHCLRGLRQVALHATMSVLTFQATALNHLLSGRVSFVRWMVPKVA